MSCAFCPQCGAMRCPEPGPGEPQCLCIDFLEYKRTLDPLWRDPPAPVRFGSLKAALLSGASNRPVAL